MQTPSFDVFISHASEDKLDVARPLAALLIQTGLKVWLDEFELVLGDSLRRKIDLGLSASRFGIVILSRSFFSKEWPKKELDALVAREDGSQKVILPVWHNISRKEVVDQSPLLADRLGISTDAGLSAVSAAVFQAVRQTAAPANQPPKPYSTESPARAADIAPNSGTGPRSIDQLTIEFIDRVQQIHDQDTEVTGVRTGFYDLDRLTGGLKAGELYVVAARPAMGCTTFALNIADHVALEEALPVLFFSPRTKSQDILNRLIAARGRIDRHGLATGRLRAEEWERLVDAVDRVHKATLFIDDTSPTTASQIIRHARNKHQELGALGLVVVDSLEALSADAATPVEAGTVHSLWHLARDLNCVVLILMPLPRSVETRVDKRPLMSDLPAGEAIEQTAAMVAFLYRDEYYSRDSPIPNTVDVLVAQHRGGRLGTIRLLFSREIARMDNMVNLLED